MKKKNKQSLGCSCETLMGDPFEGFSAKGKLVKDMTLKGEAMNYKILDSINFGTSSLFNSDFGDMTAEQQAAYDKWILSPEYAAAMKQIAAAKAAEEAATAAYAATTPTAQLSMSDLQAAARSVLNKYGSLGNVPNFRDIETTDPILWAELRRQEALVIDDSNVLMGIIFIDPDLDPNAMWVAPAPNPIRSYADQFKNIPADQRFIFLLNALKTTGEIFMLNSFKQYSPVLYNKIVNGFNARAQMTLKDRAKEVVSTTDASYIGLRKLDYLKLFQPDYFKEIVLRQAAVKYSLSPEGIAARKVIEAAQANMTQAEKDADNKARALAEAKAQADAAAAEQAKALAEAQAAVDAKAKADAEALAASQAAAKAKAIADQAALAQQQAIDSQNAQAIALANQRAQATAQAAADAAKIAEGAAKAQAQSTVTAANTAQTYTAAASTTQTAAQIATSIAKTPASVLAAKSNKINQSKIHPMLLFGLIKRR